MSRNNHTINIDNAVECLRKKITEITDDYIKNPEGISYARMLSDTISDVRLNSYDSSIMTESSASDATFGLGDPLTQHVNIPIVGYEVMEERARFTVYKLRIENRVRGDSWFVYRRYTDFARLHSKLKTDFPKYKLNLPRKRWFGDNFDERFLEERAAGLQKFINSVISDQQLIAYPHVRSFFCLDEPPSSENCDESKMALFEALDEIIYNFNKVILRKEKQIETQKLSIHNLQQKSLEWAVSICDKTKGCKRCNENIFQSLSEFQQIISSSSSSSSSSKETTSLQSDKSTNSQTSSYSST